MPPAPPIPGHAARNIDTVRELEAEFIRRRTRGERFVDRARGAVGSFPFLAAQLAAVAAWVVLNAGWVPGVAVFDPYPYYLLALLVGIEAIVLAVVVLMVQNRQTRQAEHWGHLQLQVSILAEQETTKVLELLRSMAGPVGAGGVARDPALEQMIQEIDVGGLAEHLGHARDEARAGG